MKKILKYIAGISIAVIIVLSCKKHNNSYAPPHPITDTLKGHEYIFDSQTWAINYDEVADTNVVCVTTYRPDIFYTLPPGVPSLRRDVSLRLDSSTVWIPVPDITSISASGLYWYYIDGIHGYLRILSNQFNFQLVGRNVSVKVKFL
jgi:hypothetical protein